MDQTFVKYTMKSFLFYVLWVRGICSSIVCQFFAGQESNPGFYLCKASAPSLSCVCLEPVSVGRNLCGSIAWSLENFKALEDSYSRPRLQQLSNSCLWLNALLSPSLCLASSSHSFPVCIAPGLHQAFSLLSGMFEHWMFRLRKEGYCLENRKVSEH